MLKAIKDFLFNWLARDKMAEMESSRERRRTHVLSHLFENERVSDSEIHVNAKVRLSLYNALNGKVIELSTHNEQKDEWEYELFLVPEGKTMTEALSLLLLMKGGK